MTYAVKGLGGGYPGRFSTIPYYLKVKNYSNLENRDLWEYRLNLSQDQIDRLVLHLWELGSTHFDYYFFDENCSYHLLSLLEVANPELRLRDRFPLWVIPADSLRPVLDSPGLVTATGYRPSLFGRSLAVRSRLEADEIRLAESLVDGRSPDRWAALEQHPPERRAAVLDAAEHYLQLREAQGDLEAETLKTVEHELLLRRSQLGLSPAEPEIGRPAPPEEGHDSAWGAAAFGASRRSTFEEIELRATLRDLLSRPEGYPHGMHLEMGAVRLRFDNGRRRASLERADLLKLVSLSPLDRWYLDPSWKVAAGAALPRELGCVQWRCLGYGAAAGVGLAAGSRLWRHELYYVFAEAQAQGGAGFRNNFRLGPGVSGGLVADLSPRFGLQAEGSYRAFVLGDTRRPWEVKLSAAVYPGRDSELRLVATGGTRADELVLQAGWHF